MRFAAPAGAAVAVCLLAVLPSQMRTQEDPGREPIEPRLTRDLCDELVYIPMAGSVESLNVSVATGIVLFELLRQAPK